MLKVCYANPVSGSVKVVKLVAVTQNTMLREDKVTQNAVENFFVFVFERVINLFLTKKHTMHFTDHKIVT